MIQNDRIFLLLFCAPFLVASVIGLLEIKEIKGPSSVKSGEVDEIVLDCEYEAQNVSGIEVKWFYKGDKDQVYQWIPGTHKPASPMGSLKNSIDGTFQATKNESTMYRALKLINVTHELTGSYTCKVSGFYEEATATKNLTIYVPPTEGLNLTVIPEELRAICSVSGVFPEPTISVEIHKGNETDVGVNKKNDEVELEHGLFNKITTLTFRNESILSSSEFICVMKIPGTEYELTESRLFSQDNFSMNPHLNVLLLQLCFVIMFF